MTNEELFDEAIERVRLIKLSGPDDYREELLVALHDGLYTAADLDRVRRETVQRVRDFALHQPDNGPIYIGNPFCDFLDNLEREIEEGKE